ncbi:MAG: S8/S53 family peptidase [Myxococcales bacterium]|nr:S8/S53 family peptidase [Myxococcales bacterium]
MKKPLSKDQLEAIAKAPEVDRDLGTDLFKAAKLHKPVAHRELHVWLQGKSPEALIASTTKIAGDALDWLSPVYQLAGHGPEGLISIHPHVLLVDATDAALAQRLLSELGLTLDEERTKLIKPFLFFRSRDAVFGLPERIAKNPTLAHVVRHASYECYHLLETQCLTPLDPHYTNGDQASVQRSDLGPAWDHTRGTGVNVALIDEGGILFAHEDVDQAGRANQYSGFSSGLWGPVRGDGTSIGGHATRCAGILWAKLSTTPVGAVGIAGLADQAHLYFLSLSANTGPAGNSDLIAALNAATNGSGPSGNAHVICFPLAGAGWDDAMTNSAVTSAAVATVLVCAAGDTPFPEPAIGAAGSEVLFPASVAGVVAVGATQISGANDPRLTSTAASALGSRYAKPGSPTVSGLTVVATGLSVCTTDDSAPNAYVTDFRGTSAAAATVAGIVGLLRAQHPALTVPQVIKQLKATARKVTPHGWTYQPNDLYSSSLEVGYGLVDAKQLTDFADVMIRDGATDLGAEPSGVAAFWANSDILIFDTQHVVNDASFGPNADTVFKDPTAAPAWAYVRVHNLGPNPATNVRVRLVLNNPGTGFGFPIDWLGTGPNPATNYAIAHVPGQPGVQEVNLGVLQPNTSGFAEFNITGHLPWYSGTGNAHVCALALVEADNDYPFEDLLVRDAGQHITSMQPIRNNLVQRNMTVVQANSPWRFSFNVGDQHDLADLHVEAANVPGTAPISLRLTHVPGRPNVRPAAADVEPTHGGGYTLLSDTPVRVSAGHLQGVLHLPAGTHFAPDAAATARVGLGAPTLSRIEPVRGAKQLSDGSLQLERTAIIRVRQNPGERVQGVIEIPKPPGFQDHDAYELDIVQRGPDGVATGGIRLRLVK